MQTFTDLIWKANAVSAALLFVRIYWLGLLYVYPKLFGYLLWLSLGNVTLMLIRPKPFAYAAAYFVFQTGNVVLAVFVVRELYHNALSDRSALAGYSRSIAGYVLLGAAVLAGFTATLDKNISHLRSPWLHRYLTFERSMDLMIVLLLLLGGLFLAWFPVKLRRNVLLFCTGFLAFYLARASGLLLANLLAENRIRRSPHQIIRILYVPKHRRRRVNAVTSATGRYQRYPKLLE